MESPTIGDTAVRFDASFGDVSSTSWKVGHWQGMMFESDGSFERFYVHNHRDRSYADNERSGGCRLRMAGTYKVVDGGGDSGIHVVCTVHSSDRGFLHDFMMQDYTRRDESVSHFDLPRGDTFTAAIVKEQESFFLQITNGERRLAVCCSDDFPRDPFLVLKAHHDY